MNSQTIKIGVPKETHLDECRVAITPETGGKLIKQGFSVMVESGAGAKASYSDKAYQTAGIEVVDTKTLWSTAQLIIKVIAPSTKEIQKISKNTTLISFIWPAQNPKLLRQLANKKMSVLAMDSIPRISRAQKLDALSSMSNVGGYRAVVEAAYCFGRLFSGQVTAAGKIAPAKVMVIGAGVAGLAAIAAAGSLGAIVRAFDTRPEVKEQIQSMGAEFLELDFSEDGSGTGGYAKTMSKEFIAAEMALFAKQSKEVDIIITTALIPGKPAPKLISADMVKSMRDGSVIVDLAAEQGGNCALTKAGKLTHTHGVSIIGYTSLPSRMAAQSSQLYSTNVYHLLTELSQADDQDKLAINMQDEVIRGATVVHRGEITWPPPPTPPPSPTTKKPVEPTPVPVATTPQKPSPWLQLSGLCLAVLGLLGLGTVAPANFMAHLTVFVLSCFIGYMVIWNVTPTLHTPLMSVTNAISSIIIIGALTQIGSDHKIVTLLAAIAILISTMNIVGGFAVTQRMLKMFKK